MPPSETTSRRRILDRLMPRPTTQRWGTWLYVQNDHSDKEYRIVVDGDVVSYQYGRRGTNGETTTKRYATPEKATEAARKQWIAKEAKGYTAMCGVIELDNTTTAHWRQGWSIRQTIDRHITTLSSTGPFGYKEPEPDEQVYLLRTPAVFKGDLIPSLFAHAICAGVCPSGDWVRGDTLFITPVPTHVEAAVQAICPMSAPLGTWGDGGDATALGMLATALGNTIPTGWSTRAQLADALELANALI